MTGQIPDTVVYDGREYVLAGIDGTGLFAPSDHGLQVGMISTGCRRGFLCEYTVDGDELFLTALELGGAHPPVTLFGADMEREMAAVYAPIRVRQPFTGGMLLAAGFIDELYQHIGHQPAWTYATVLELTFEYGSLEVVRDLSELMAQRRSAWTSRAESGNREETRPRHTTDPLAPNAFSDDDALEHLYFPML